MKNNQVKSKRGGRRDGAGRPKNSPNKLTTTIKAAIEQAFNDVGAHEYLAKMAYDQPSAFMSLLGRAMPQQIDANVSGSIGMPAITLSPPAE